MRAKRLIYFLSTADEASLSAQLVAAFPHLVFIDDCRWSSPEPPCRPSIDACASKYVYLWNKALFPKLPSTSMTDGSVRGPQSYHVVQFGRNWLRDGFMQSAQLSMSIDDNNADHKQFCEKVYRTVKKQHARTMRCIDTATGQTIRNGINNLVLGADSAEQARQGLRFVLGFGSREVFEPENS